MKTQTAQHLEVAGGTALRVAPTNGELTVVSGQVWLTRLGDSADHVLQPGQSVVLGAADEAVVEAWQPGQPATLSWLPRRQSLTLRAVATAALRALAGRAVLHNAGAFRHQEPACNPTFLRPNTPPSARN